jgi:hypothetical protein
MEHSPGIGATGELNLRVSVATLVRVVFTTEQNVQMLVLERKGIFLPRDGTVMVKAQPFGGAVRIHDLARLKEIVGDFRFDSERSQAERDFRIFVQPSAWEELKQFCLDQFQASKEAVFETSAERELEEELHDSLSIHIHPDQYVYHPLWSVVENDPAPTSNIHAEHQPTVRMYRVFEAQIIDPALWRLVMMNSNSLSDQDLKDQAMADKENGGKGRANACSVVPMKAIRHYYSSLSFDEHDTRVLHQGTIMEGNICALLEDGVSPKYRFIRD